MAVFSLPSEMILFFKHHIDFLSEHAVDADRRKHSDENEAPRHYIDLEYYINFNEKNNINEIPTSYQIADSLYSVDSLNAWGTLPWSIKFVYFSLVDAFLEKDVQSIKHNLADLGHYVADCNVPLHTTVNYNGQLTNQVGIHGLWETLIPEKSSANYDLLVGKAVYIDNIDDFIWKLIYQSHSQKDSVLNLESELTLKFSEDTKYAIKDNYKGVKKKYSNEFIIAYENSLNNMVERNMRNSIRSVSSLWYTAWVNAGQPDLQKLLSDSNEK